MPHAESTWATVALVILLSANLSALAQDQPRRSFEIASVKPKSANDSGPPIEVTQGGGLIARSAVSFLVMIAYKVKPFQLVGLPGWADWDEYVIVAKPPEEARPSVPEYLTTN